MVKKTLYKLYVVALLMFVLWAAQLFYSVIYWEFEIKFPDASMFISEKESDLSRLAKFRRWMGEAKTKSYDLGDVSVEEHFEKGHFHHVGGMLNTPVLNGCDYCHTSVAHKKGEEARAFRNMHSYFMACETCHFMFQFKEEEVEHGWINVANGEATIRPVGFDLTKPLSTDLKDNAAFGNIKIIPWLKRNQDRQSIIGDSDIASAEKLLRTFTDMSNLEQRSNLSHMHRGLTKKAHRCNDCHSKQRSVIAYSKLGYSAQDTKKLMDVSIASVVSEYNQFHFPNLFIRKDDRNNKNRQGN